MQLCEFKAKLEMSEDMMSPCTPPPHFSEHRQARLDKSLVLAKWQADTTGPRLH